NNAVLDLSLGFNATGNPLFTIINNTGTAQVAGTFAGLPQGASLVVMFSGQPHTFTISYTGGDGNDVVLTHATNRIWSGAAAPPTHNTGSDATTGQGTTAPAAGDALIFPAALATSALISTNDLTAGTSFSSITIQGSGYTIGGNAVALTGPLDASYTSGASTD